MTNKKPQNLELARSLLTVIERNILPLTQAGVLLGDKVFGAAVVTAKDRRVVVTATNRENSTGCPLWHGEMCAIADYYDKSERPAREDCLFLSTHEPCPMCAAALAWAGFGEVYYLFDYSDTAQMFNIPHDANILRELFPSCSSLNRDNRFYRMRSLDELIANDAELTAQRHKIADLYRALSEEYQRRKEQTVIPLK